MEILISSNNSDNSAEELFVSKIREHVDHTKQYDYSRFYYVGEDDVFNYATIKDITEQYLQGCKLYCVFAHTAQMLSLANALDAALTQRGLIRKEETIEIAFEEQKSHLPQLDADAKTFVGFHCNMSVITASYQQEIPSFIIRNGECDEAQKAILMQLGEGSPFNPEQYFAEHAPAEKNIIIRAGAGTGKTYTMLSRIGYICYTQNIRPEKMADRIAMITFTNEAADQMKEKLKAYFQNCYLITSRVEYLSMIAKIDDMQIGTVDSFAKELIVQFGISLGYGVDLSVVSDESPRRKIVSDILDRYIEKRIQDCGRDYIDRLGIPIYTIRDTIADFVRELQNKGVDLAGIKAEDFGTLGNDDTRSELHELLATVIPAVEREYLRELRNDNRINQRGMASLLNRFILSAERKDRLGVLRRGQDGPRFMLVDEFQDTDDARLALLRNLTHLLGYRLFLVGDIKQCIYRFRGAEEKAFDQLRMDGNSTQWLEFSLLKNYRTDTTLLNLFALSFARWGAAQDELLSYDSNKDRLVGTKDYNGYLASHKERFFRKIPIAKEELRIPMLAEEIRRIYRRIHYEEEQRNIKLSEKERSIAILVRENWQAEMIRTECAKLLPDIPIQTNTGGDLYMSQPALDMLTLVNALVHFDEADALYNLVTSNFFELELPRSNLFEIRMKIRNGGWKVKADKREQVKFLIRSMNAILKNMDDERNTWETLVASLRGGPILQSVRQIYAYLKPWCKYSSDPWKQHYYQLNVDLLFEQLMNACNAEQLTINTLQDHLYNCIASRVPVDSRMPSFSQAEIPVHCFTVHKSKGLEYGHVIMPFCLASIDTIKNARIRISATKNGERYRIGYSMSIGDTRERIQNEYYDVFAEKAEKCREETRLLYVAMTRSIRSFSWIAMEGKYKLSWQNLIETEA